jgi:hypothetical protein
LATLFALEGVIPFYDQHAGRWVHAARNGGLALMTGLVGASMAPLILLSIELAQTRGWGLPNALELPAPIALVAVILLHHSNIRLPEAWDRRLRILVVPPSMHRVHHSEITAETNSNYA